MQKQEKLALSIVETLTKNGYQAYYAGGWVRDFLLNRPSTDIDIATDATLETVIKLFDKTIPVGAAFGVIIVMIRGEQFEVATFRQDLDYTNGRAPNEVAFTDAEGDAIRRDFTINGMFYDPIKKEVIDYVQGQQDLKDGIVRAIGDAEERFREDRLRMIRAVRFAARFSYNIEEETLRSIRMHAHQLFPAVSVERVWQECKSMVGDGNFAASLRLLHHLHLLPSIFPALHHLSEEAVVSITQMFLYYKKDTPPAYYLYPLFACDKQFSAFQELAHFFHMSNHEKDEMIYLHSIDQMITADPAYDAYSRAQLYAHPRWEAALHVAAALQEKREEIIQEHQSEYSRLLWHIQRIQNKQPIITSTDIANEGIKPGPLMGQLLKEGERLAINHNITVKEEVLSALKSSALWPTTPS